MGEITEAAGNCKVRFQLTQFMLDADLKWPPFEAESMWAEWTGPSTARLLNNPFYVKGVSYLDEVRVKKAELPPGMSEDEVGPNFVEFDSVVSRSGHGIVRVILATDEGRELAEQTMDEIEKLGCSWESTGDSVVSIDLPPGVNQSEILRRLEDAASQKAIYVDVGYLAQGESV